MFLKKWDELPQKMQVSEVKEYYDMLTKKRFSLLLIRIMDIVLSLLLIILLSPVLLIFAIWIKLDSEGPIFYRQERITQYGRAFKIYKFRTMVLDADKMGSLVTVNNDSRITHVGEKIRKFRIDEIPQLFNVLKGEMTFVGTRPEVRKYVDQYSNEMLATLLLPAGITSSASIYFRDESKILSTSIDINASYINEILPRKMIINLEDIKKISIYNVIRISFKTIIEVLK